MFVEKIGISPFIKLYQKKNIIDACIMGNQYDVMEYLVKGSSRKSLENTNHQRYILSDKISK
jgi:hypothetical protein